jgi:sugar phosphate isomerase/epimerase
MHDYDPEKPGRREGQMGSVVPCGEGIIDWPTLLTAALKSPITDHGFIVEIETGEPFEGLRNSIDFLRTVEI